MIAQSFRTRLASLTLAICAGCTMPPPQEPVEPPNVRPPEAKSVPAPVPAPQIAPKSAPAAVAPLGKGDHQLALGIQSYEDGDYKAAARQLQAALDLGLESRRDQAKAHKYIAFIVCATGRERACREQFRKALDADPAFDLEPAEAGNPVWSAALRSVKAERARKAK
jgi:hypothetical protein